LLKFRTKAKLWNHIQDFEFDAARETGVYSKEGKLKRVLFNFLFKTESKLLNQGNINSTISYKMLEKLKSKSKSDSFYFPNWLDPCKIDPSTSKQHDFMKTSRFKILYSGNIGDKQDWEFFLLFINKLRSYNVEIVIVGDGAKREWLCDKIKNFENVNYYEPIEYSDLSSLLCSADLHVLFQKNNVIDSVMPSKLLGMMASAKPSLITGNFESEVRIIMEESKGGYYVTANNIEECISIVKNLMQSPKDIIETGLNARNYVVNKFSSEKVLADFENKLAQLIRK
jgi:colanic acid biosynthesis glycosyl transferase WcaI